MRFEIVTIFPEFFTSIFENGILRRALAEGLVTVGVHDLRAFTHDRHRTVDDRPFGGGEGMVLSPSRWPRRWPRWGFSRKRGGKKVRKLRVVFRRREAGVLTPA